jgi:hypothetical protein
MARKRPTRSRHRGGVIPASFFTSALGEFPAANALIASTIADGEVLKISVGGARDFDAPWRHASGIVSPSLWILIELAQRGEFELLAFDFLGEQRDDECDVPPSGGSENCFPDGYGTVDRESRPNRRRSLPCLFLTRACSA